MSPRLRRYAPVAYWIALVAMLATGGWYIVNRTFDVYVQVGLSLTVAGLAAGVILDPERVRRALTGRQARYGSNALVLSIAFLGILVVVNYLVYSNPLRWDLTEDKEFTLSQETQLVLAELAEPVVIKGFYTPDLVSSRDAIRPLLDQYRLESDGLLDYEFIDPLENPVAADEYGVTWDGSLVVVVKEASEVLQYPDEQDISSAIVRLTNPGERKVYFLTGHGERDLGATGDHGYSQVSDTLEAKSYVVDTLNLLTDPAVPEDALLIVIAGPQVPFSQDEVDLLDAFLARGGGLIALMEPEAPQEEALERPLIEYLDQAWGVVLNEDIVVDLSSSLPLAGIGDPGGYGSHAITERMVNLATYYPSARSIDIRPSEDGRATYADLVQTVPNSWAESDVRALAQEGVLEFNEGEDRPGPLTLAVAAEDYEREARLVVIGDSDFAANADFFGLGNGDMLINSVDWATRQEGLITITPKATTQRYVVPPSVQTVGLIFLATLIVIPGAVVASGVSVWWRRRKRA